MGDKLTVEHISGDTREVMFDDIFGDKLDRVRVWWPLAGFYDVDIETGKLLGSGRKKGRKGASVWSVIPKDLARIRDTQRVRKEERRALFSKNKRGTQ